MPIKIDPNETYLFGDSDTPVQGSSVIGFQSDYTKKSTENANRQRQMDAREAQIAQLEQQAQQGLAIIQAFDEDPFGTLDRLKQGLVKNAMESGVDIPEQYRTAPSQPAPAGEPTQGTKNPWDTDEGKGLVSVVNEMRAEIEGLRSQLAVKDEISTSTEKYPQMKDPAFKARLAQHLQAHPGTPLETGIRSLAYEDTQAEMAKMQEQMKLYKREQLFSAPDLGFGAPGSEGGPTGDHQSKWTNIVEGLVDAAAGNS